MKIAGQYLSAIERLGYTRQEAEFLYLAATFSGYFLPRQFVAFAGVKWGKRSTNLTAKLERRGHATWREYTNVGGVYHLSSKTLYRLIDRENLRNHRRHSVAFIRTRLLLLDFILANQTYEYLETDQDKLCYFHRQMELPLSALPAKSYARRAGSEPVLRYFVDKFPLFFETPDDRAACRVTFSYVDAGEATLRGFAHHVDLYAPLLRRLPHSCFTYISNSTVHFAAAEKRFRLRLDRAFHATNSTDVVRYFQLRSLWEQKQYGSLSIQDIEWLENANARIRTPEMDALFSSWRAGTVPDEDLIQPAKMPSNRADPQFGSRLVTPPAVPAQNAEKRGEQ
jgi:hypothetical protein